ncbi:Tyrosine-protein kinase ZAP-70 [Porites harrisoni]
MWEIFSYIQTPFEGMTSPEVIRFLADGRRLGCPEKCPPKNFEVMESCWLEDPKKRPSFYTLEIRDLPSCLSEQSKNG